jgi:hypothetical protein
MSSSNNDNSLVTNLPEATINLNQTTIQHYMTRQNTVINHEGYIDNVKMKWNTRLLALNPNEYCLSDTQKMYMLIQNCKRLDIDICFMNEVNTK